MKSTGIVRNIDELGRIVIPKEMRKYLNIENGDPIEILVDSDKIYLQKYEPCCIFCGSGKDILVYKGKKICKQCFKGMKAESASLAD